MTSMSGSEARVSFLTVPRCGWSQLAQNHELSASNCTKPSHTGLQLYVSGRLHDTPLASVCCTICCTACYKLTTVPNRKSAENPQHVVYNRSPCQIEGLQQVHNILTCRNVVKFFVYLLSNKSTTNQISGDWAYDKRQSFVTKMTQKLVTYYDNMDYSGVT